MSTTESPTSTVTPDAVSLPKHFVDVIEFTKRGMIEALEEAIKDDQDVNEKDKYGSCAVVIAARRNDFAMLKLLVNAGARLDMTGSAGLKSIAYARQNSNQNMVDYINSKTQEELGSK